MSKFTFHSDPGHGWLEVERTLLEDLEILNDISPYSYEAAGKVYLEEDCDMGKFRAAYMRAYGKMPEMNEEFLNDTPIRRMDSFRSN